MEQSITIKIAGKDYPLKATSPEMEQLMRLAAETVNQKLALYDAKFPDKTLVDKLSFVALNETVSRMSYQKRLSSVNEEAKRMLSQTSAYLDNIDKKK
jgi:cell division protein ZapA (FtsZ GTPase activity inhibitor)